MKPLISIIIPTYNRDSYLGATLDSILNQKHTNWECIVIDDGSTDYTKELMDFYMTKDKRYQFYNRPISKLKGANSCRNFGFEKSKGEYVNWFDSDDLMHPDFLITKLNTLKDTEANCCICAFQTFKFNKGVKGLAYKSIIGSIDIFQNICTQKYAIPTHGPLWRRTYLKTVNLFNEDLSISQDLEFHNRTLKKDKLIKIIPEPLYYLRQQNESITQGFYKNILIHFDSYFFVRKSIIESNKGNLIIIEYFKKELMGIFRYLLTLKEYDKSLFILNYLTNSFHSLTLKQRLQFSKIYFLFSIIRIARGGETKFKRYLYLPQL